MKAGADKGAVPAERDARQRGRRIAALDLPLVTRDKRLAAAAGHRARIDVV